MAKKKEEIADLTHVAMPFFKTESGWYNSILHSISFQDRGMVWSLMTYCAANRNGGRIVGCRRWTRKVWEDELGGYIDVDALISRLSERVQHGVRTQRTRTPHGVDTEPTRTPHATPSACSVLAWDGDDLLVLIYPSESERNASNGGKKPHSESGENGGSAGGQSAIEEKRKEKKGVEDNVQTPPTYDDTL